MNQPDVDETQQEYPPFSGSAPVCVKCRYYNDGDATAYVSYLACGLCDHLSGMVLGQQMNERLHRTCGRCGFTWDEAVCTPDRTVL